MIELSSSIEEAAKKIILEAGFVAKKLKKKLSIKYKSESQPVTNVDLAIDNLIKNYFKQKTPTYGWVSEETEDNYSRFKSDTFWCLDPIDGTRSYISGKPEYTISLALINNKEPILGLVLNPETEELFFAKKHKGAYCNDKKIMISKNENIFSSSFAISRSEVKKLKKYNLINQKNIVEMGSIAYKIALVAKGKIDVALSFTDKNDWDLAASDLILKEAGGNIKKISGEQIVYNSEKMKIESVIATNQKLSKKLCNKLNEK